MFENPRRGRQARHFTTNAPKILDLKSSSEQIFSRKLPLGAPISYIVGFSSAMKIYPAGFLKTWLPPNRLLPSNHSQKVDNIKTKNASIAVSLPFPSSSSFLPLLVWLLSLSGAENLPFGPFSLKWLQISLGSLSKNRLEILSAKDWSVGKRHFFWSVMAAHPEKDLSKVTAGIVVF